jgi:threonine dehydrogenase-like Zn-dependent dehydrogenase
MDGVTRFGVLTADKKAEIHTHAIPRLKPDEVLVRNHSCNICTFDYQQWLGLRQHQPYPQAWGHEDAGEIVELGPEVKGYQVGDHVVSNIYHPCLECSPCRKGLNHRLCENPLPPNVMQQDEYGYYGLYGCSEYKVIPKKFLFKVSAKIPYEHAGFCEPLATVIHGIHRLRVAAGEKVLVIGAGTMGLLNAQVARYYGAEVIISELMDQKIQTAQRLGFTKIIQPSAQDYVKKIKEYTEGAGPDAIIVAVGATAAYEQAFQLAPVLCRVLIFAASYPPPLWKIDPNQVHYQMWEIIGVVGAELKNYQESADLLGKQAIALEPLIEERFELTQVQKAFEKATTPGSYRVAVIF